MTCTSFLDEFFVSPPQPTLTIAMCPKDDHGDHSEKILLATTTASKLWLAVIGFLLLLLNYYV